MNRKLNSQIVLCLALGAVVSGSLGAFAQQQPQLKQQVGDIEIAAAEITFDGEKYQYQLTGNVDVKSKDTHLTSDVMTLQLTSKKELVSAKCTGKVFIEKKSPEKDSQVTARSQELDYHELEQTAALKGSVRVEQTSPRLAKPAVILGEKVDLDLKADKNVVLRGPNAQAKVHVEPKGDPGKPTPEPVDLTADRIEMNSRTQQYVATGKPAMTRPSSKLQAKRIRFELDEKGSEVKVAYADEDVIIDDKNESGTVLHATANQGVYRKPENLVTLDGTVAATVTRAGEEQPSVYTAEHFEYNLKNGGHSLKGAKATIRQEKKDGEKATAPAVKDAADKK